jgi:hypothetical protein
MSRSHNETISPPKLSRNQQVDNDKIKLLLNTLGYLKNESEASINRQP